MKRVFLNFKILVSFSLICLSMLTSCNHTDLAVDDKSNFSEFTAEKFQNLYENYASSIGTKFNAKIKEVTVGIPPKNIIDFVNMNYRNIKINFDNTIIVKIIPNSSAVSLRTESDLNTYVIAVSGTNDYITVAEYQQEAISATLSMSQNSNNTVTVGGVEDVQELSWGRRWFKCMKRVYDDEVTGVIIGTLGVAGGVGCGPCGVAAGVLTGVAALACMG